MLLQIYPPVHDFRSDTPYLQPRNLVIHHGCHGPDRTWTIYLKSLFGIYRYRFMAIWPDYFVPYEITGERSVGCTGASRFLHSHCGTEIPDMDGIPRRLNFGAKYGDGFEIVLMTVMHDTAKVRFNTSD